MQWTVPELPQGVLATFVATGVVAVIIGITQSSKRPNLNAFPTVGSSGWLGGIKFMMNAADIAQEGYRKHKGAPFKISTPFRWDVVISDRAHIQEMRNAPDNELQSLEPKFDDLNGEFILGPEVIRNPYHFMLIRSQLTRKLGVLFPEVREEIIAAFDELLDLKDNEWKSVPALATIEQVVSRASNRAFVGLPLCRNPDFVNLNIKFTVDGIVDSIIIGLFPKHLRAFAVRFLTSIPKKIARGVGHLRPIIEERRKCLNKYGSEWPEKPIDLLSWMMDEAGPDATAESLTNYILSVNFVAINTSSNVFTNALYNLAENPWCVQPLREEIEGIVEQEGWSKASLGKMRKLDSFLKESIRMDSVEITSMIRHTAKDFVFSDGTLIPKGTRICTPQSAIHYDDTLYKDSGVFHAFRFVDMGEEDGHNVKNQFATTSPEYLAFGHGRHACPGRFFAAVELKTMLAHIVTAYDVKLEDTTRPKSFQLGSLKAANSTARVLFRKRVRPDGNH